MVSLSSLLKLFKNLLVFERSSTDILSSLSGLELLSQGKSVSSSLLKHFIQSGALYMKEVQTMNSISRTSLCLHSGILPSAGFVVLFHFSSLRGALGTHAASDRQIFVSFPPQSLVLLLADQIGRRPSPVAFFFLFLLSTWREISSHHSSALLSYLQ